MYDAPFLDHLHRLLLAALPRWGLPAGTRLSLLNVSENATFLAEGDTMRLVLRVYRQGYHQPAEMQSELAWIAALRQAGVVETPAPVPAADGTLLQALPDGAGTRHAVAFVHMAGEEPARDLPRRFRQLGGISARLHAHARGWAPPPGFTRKRWDADTMLGPAGHWGDWRAGIRLDAGGTALLERVETALREALARYGDTPDRFGLVHADLRLTNLLADGPRLGVIDFDDCGFCWHLYDFAAAVSFMEHEPAVPALMEAWVAGYRQVAPLAETDVALLPVFVMLRRMLLTAWLASHAETPTAQALGAGYTAGTVALGRNFLARQAGIGAASG
ncbi:aminoglycoside phosphotransferase [Pseudoroseomonas wenyumeiae]|uniref:Aminoglycoside phosphotransferase n=1 Tax=Teichococcus wenyumeiae TaxID=2478470 RepID=A0A3A9K2V8_9PROT|nr:phosphotransferase [Pseudoroseomonas wenyumeiae]RKK05689.1 aminoglycoside phosphotransferase [Pseudoroseomonas wenyumeiae]RMI26000.1 aminoglycoside phosphotransferase [Pseudoroseomonas wenyumeiae]